MKPYPPSPHRTPNGFTVLELLVSVAIVGFVMVAAGALWGTSSKSFQQQRDRNDQEALIDGDIARMEDRAYKYTCCSGTCGFTASGSTCIGKVGEESYYFPLYASSATSRPNITTMETNCRNGTLVDNLATDLRGIALSRPGDMRASVPLPTRTVSVDNALAHRLRITYTGNNNLTRSTIIVPTVARWCP